MPLVRISVSATMDEGRRKLLPHAVYDAMRAAISIPEGDMFVTLTPHAEGEMCIDPNFMGMERTEDFALVHITLRRGRTPEAKQALYREIARLFHERAKIAPDDVMIVLNENESPDWSFGKGEAQFMPKTGAAS